VDKTRLRKARQQKPPNSSGNDSSAASTMETAQMDTRSSRGPSSL